MRRKLTITFFAFWMVFGLWQMSETALAQSRLTLAMVLTGLQTKGKTPETATLAARNVFITKRVQNSGVTFSVTAEIERELRNAGATTTLINAIRQNGPAPVTTSKPRAVFKEIWVDYGVTEENQLGMRIHTKFTTYGMKNMPGFLAIEFKDSDGIPLRDRNGLYKSPNNNVAVYREIAPAYDPAEYEDLSVFMPYSELDLTSGNWDLVMDVKLVNKAGALITELTKKPFEYKKPRDWSGVTFKVVRTWAEYGVVEEGRTGMRLHVHFEVTGLKGVDAMMLAGVQRKDGTPLPSETDEFSNSEGHFVGTFAIKPGYETTVFKDATIFLPYEEFVIARGKWDLRLDIDLVDNDYGLIKHMTFHEFQFTQK